MRGLLRDYRDKASRHLNQLREELASTAEALQRILGTLSQSEDDHEVRLRQSLASLRTIAQSTGPAAGAKLAAIADAIEQSLDQLRQQHQLTVSQFLLEISLLHKRIHTLEAAASIDDLSRVFSRAEMEEHIRSCEPGSVLLVLKVRGFCGVDTRFGPDVARELVGAFTKRLRNIISPNAPIGRWVEEGFVVILQATKEDAVAAARSLSSQLSGAYACLQNGKTVRPSIRVDAAVLDLVPSETEQTIDNIGKFLKV